jgi:hypothetical protein
MMKNFKGILPVIALLVFMMFGSANDGRAQTKEVFLDFENLILYKVYKKDSVIAKLGQPDKYSSNKSEFGLNEEYYFGENMLHFSEDGVFTGFALLDRRFAIFSSFVPDGIRVGDQVSKFQQMSFGKLETRDEHSYAFMDNPKNGTPLMVHHSNGIITKLLLF